MYSRRVDTYDSREQIYETKLLSLFNCRAVRDDTIEQFELVQNIREEEFGNVRYKIKIKGHDKPGIVFVKILHKTNKKRIHKIDLAAYVDFYMRTKWTFGGTEWLFVLYTNANIELDTQYIDGPPRSGLSAKLNEIFDTGGNVKCPNNEENMEYLSKKSIKDQITLLAEIIAYYIDHEYFHMTLRDALILRYHVILARKVFDVSEFQPESEATPRYCIASFRQDFFDNTEEYMVMFRTTLSTKIIKRRKLKPSEIQLYVSEFLSDPTDATRLSKLIGTVATYDNGQLEFVKQFNMKLMDVPRATVNQAIKLAETETLSSVKLKVPTAFGNKDLTISGSDAEIEERICHLASKMKELLDKCEASKIVTIDESTEDGFLQLNGGIAGAIGNIFVLDENTKLLKITDNWNSLSTLAQRLYKKLSDVIDNLHEYTFCFKVDKFPVLSFDSYGEKIVKDFLNNLLVYCNQAEENDVQEILKNEIENLQRNQPNYFQIKSDVIFLKYHEEIQNRNMQLFQEDINLVRQSIDEILFNSLIKLISKPYINKIKQYDYTFTEDAVRSLNLLDQLSNTMIVTENCVLTVVKVMQHLKTKQEHFVLLDVEYIASLPANDRNALRGELRNANQQDVLILICDKIDYSNEKPLLENIANAVRNKTIIVILNLNSLGILYKYFPEADNILHDKKFSLMDVDVQSQKSILKDATAVFPGVEIRLRVFLRGWPRTSHASPAAGDKVLTSSATGSHDSDFEHTIKIGFKEYLEELRSPAAGDKVLTSSATGSHDSDFEHTFKRGFGEYLEELWSPAAGNKVLTSSASGSHDSDFEHTFKTFGEYLEELWSPAAGNKVLTSSATGSHDLDFEHTRKRKLQEYAEETRSSTAGDKVLTSSATGSHDSDFEHTRKRKLQEYAEETRSSTAGDKVLTSSATGSHDSDFEHTRKRKLQEYAEETRSSTAGDKVLRSSATDSHDSDLEHTIKRKLQENAEEIRSAAAGGTETVADMSRAAGSQDSGSLLDELHKARNIGMKQRRRLYEYTLRKESNIGETQRRSSQDEGYGVFHETSSEPTRALSPIPATTFNGRRFYKMFKDAEFLKSDANVQEILARGHELRDKINRLEPGKTMIIEEMNINPNTPLTIKKCVLNTKVNDFEFTYNRLVGLTAAYVYENRKRFPNILAIESEELGLEWEQNDDEKCKLYLSAVSGAEHFIDQFSFWPLVCGLRKYQLKKLPVDEVLKIGNIKITHRQTMAWIMKSNMVTAERIWYMIPNTSIDGLYTLMNTRELWKW